MKTTLSTILFLLVLAGLSAPGLRAQGITPGELPMAIPEDFQKFWERYSEAKADDDEDDMDREVRRDEETAIAMLDFLLDSTAKYETPTLTGEARTLAWAIDRVTRGERYIERARYVLNLEKRDRGARRIAWARFTEAIAESEEAVESGDPEAFDAVIRSLEDVAQLFVDIEDYESALNVTMHSAWVTQRRGLDYRWDRAVIYERAIKLGELLPYRDPMLVEAEESLDALTRAGFDPSKPKSEAPTGTDGGDVGTIDRPGTRGGGGGGGGDGAASSGGGGGSIGSYAEGSERTVVELESSWSKKGPKVASMPNFYPEGQFFAWPYTLVTGKGPSDFDSLRGEAVTFKPYGQHWQLLRDGQSQFLIDTDRDGEIDLEFTGKTNPTLIEVPGPEKGQVTPLMVCIPADRENVVGFEANFAPTEQYARLRFQPAEVLEAKVEGEKLQILDLNLDGQWGPPIEQWDDVITDFSDEIPIAWWEPDGVQVGKAKVSSPLSPVMQIKGKWYRTEVDSVARTIATRELDLPTGEVKLDYDVEEMPTHLVAREVGGKLEGAMFNLMPAKRGGKVELPAGTYQIVMGQIATGRGTSVDTVRIYTGSSPQFQVKEGETTELALGAPYKLIFEHSQEGDERVVRGTSFRVFGRFGEEYAVFFDEPLQPEISARKVGGVDIIKERPTRFPGIEDWQKLGDRCLYFPIDFRFDNPDGDAVEVMAVQEEHSLLGGPLTSDWIK